MNLYCWLSLYAVVSVLFAHSFGYFGMSRNVDTGEEVDSPADGIFAAQVHRATLKDFQ
jgi:hypothetical protein